MIKTVYYIRNTKDGPHIDSIMSAEWPEHLMNATIETVAQIRGVPPAEVMQEILSEDVKKLLCAYPMMEIRARLNDLSGPHVVNSAEVPCDAFLIEHAARKRKTTKRKV